MDQLLQTDRNVTFLHPLMDLLSRPSDQKETLGERLAALLADLIQTLSNFQSEQATLSDAQVGLTEAVNNANERSEERLMQLETKLTKMIEAEIESSRERYDRMEKKIDRMLTLLSLPLD
ncbi:hypothetical protein [Marivita sp. GX14005]|uniref:hypothetical protein n=1 Tax=Marivita sp. GX14005 TaxID=2942276 RepID=UPI002018D95F|nr:hypothetical protein [Marivita sp. GX14005]MCL3882672.1 hypothetical protein [Marivita sp. GX14005]